MFHLLVNHAALKSRSQNPKKAPNQTSFTEIVPLTPPLPTPIVLLAISGTNSVFLARVWHCCVIVQDLTHCLP